VSRASLVPIVSLALVGALAWPSRAGSQTPPSPQAPTPVRARPAPLGAEQARTRFQLSLMEGVLEKAVEQAAREVARQMQPVSPDLFMWGSMARARGFRLQGYGVFFDVEVPTLRRSVAWSFQIIGPPGAALQELRDHVRTISDPKTKEHLDQALKRLELQLPAAEQGQPGVSKAAAAPAADPNEVYTSEVTGRLIDAMLDFGGLQVGKDEWLTVAARDSEGPPRLTPDEPFDIVTVFLQIKGSDLLAFREGKLAREEARKRVDVKEF
jgi:hypothetical protein